MVEFVPKEFDGLDARPNKARADSLPSSASASDAAWLRGNVRNQDASLASDDPVTRSSNGNGRHLRVVPKPVDIEEENWNCLFGAVEEKLRNTVNAALTAATPEQAVEKVSVIRTVVLDCVRSLDTLFEALKQERASR